jgi:preflagellin peptidase FlaK
MDPMQLIDYSSIAASLVFFSYGSWSDLRSREVSNKVWLLYGPIGLALTIGRVLIDPSLLVMSAASIGLTTLLSFTVFYFGLFAGADAKALICLSLAIPLFPSTYETLLGYVHPIFPMAVFAIGYVCSVSVAVWIGAKNLPRLLGHRAELFKGLEQEPPWKKAIAAITGYPCTVAKLSSTFYLYPMEEVVEGTDGAKRRLSLYFNAEADRDQMVAKLVSSLSKVGSPNEVWVSPGIPMIVFMLIGLIITLIFGDLIFAGLFLMMPR